MTLAIVCFIFIKHQMMGCRVNYESENVLKKAITNSGYSNYAYVEGDWEKPRKSEVRVAIIHCDI